jgi:hypothetical protein
MTWHVTVLTSATRTPKWPTRRQTHNIVMSIVRAPIPRDDWIPVSGAVFVSMKEGRDALKQMESGYWKWAYPTGDGKTQARFACTGHLDCKRVLRVRFDGEHYIIEGCGVHSLEPCFKKRSNSTLTRDMEHRVRESMDQGGRSAGLRVALTNTAAGQLRKDGLDPMDYKADEGGLIGALSKPEYIRIRHACAYSMRILIVSRMYPACNMYPVWIHET